jgi:hypothetical protein
MYCVNTVDSVYRVKTKVAVLLSFPEGSYPSHQRVLEISEDFSDVRVNVS